MVFIKEISIAYIKAIITLIPLLILGLVIFKTLTRFDKKEKR